MAANQLEPIVIDGTALEGGDKILRISASLSAILGTPITVIKIRSKPEKPGEKPKTKGLSQQHLKEKPGEKPKTKGLSQQHLKEKPGEKPKTKGLSQQHLKEKPGEKPKTKGLSQQHLKVLGLIEKISNGQLEGGTLGSPKITFRPGSICGGVFEADMTTAGSTCLLMQSILPCCLFAKISSSITIKGGTNADHAPSIDYIIEVFKRLCARIGISFEVSLEKRGFFPKGQGQITLEVDPMMNCIPLPAFSLMEQGKVISISGISCVSGARELPLADKTADAAEIILKGHYGCDVKVNIRRYEEEPEKTLGNGSFIIIWAKTSSDCILGSSAVVKTENEAEYKGRKVANDLIKDVASGSCVDKCAQDQLVIFMALAKGTSRIRTANLTLHTKTAIHIAEEVAKVKFNLREDPSTNTVIIECEGVGAEAHSG